MLKIFKNHALLIFIILFILLTGCHNNAHLRTQKILKSNEKVYSASGVLPIGGINEENDRILNNTGVAALRGELSRLKGSGTAEFGSYIGAGANFNDDEFGIILGLDYRIYSGLNQVLPKKIGSKLEFNLSSNGYVFSLNPNFTTVTNTKRPSYYGFHGLLSNGNLKDWVYLEFRSTETDETHDWSNDNYFYWWRDNLYKYRFTSLGAGITYGYEFFNLKNQSFQIQLDVSLIKNTRLLGSFNTDLEDLEDLEFYNEYSDYQWIPYSEFDKIFSDNPDGFNLMLSLSAGMNFFKPDKKKSSSFEPFPAPEKNIKQLIFDPETGELIKSTDSIFDPETGELIKSKKDEKFLDNSTFDNYTNIEIINKAKTFAIKSHDKKLHNSCGVGSCLAAPFWGVSLLASLVYMNTNILSSFDSYNPMYQKLNQNQKLIFKSAYKDEERKLRKRDIRFTQKGCFGLWVGFLAFMIITDS